MAKRKIDCKLDDIVMEYLKKVKCERTSKMFGTERSAENDHSKSLKKFMKFLKQNETEKENRVEDDLGFEINFGAFQPATKVSFLSKFYNFQFKNFLVAIERSEKTFDREEPRSQERN